MATLTFNQDGNQWIAEATVHADYLLHIERNAPGTFSISQRSTGTGLYADCLNVPGVLYHRQVIDHAFGHGVYPEGGLSIRITSGSEVTSATLTEGVQ